MEEGARSALASWESFYVIVGSSGAALTGLQFVVIVLIAEAKTRSTTREIDAFGTPTVVHFCAVLLLSAIQSAPWHALSSPGFVLAACGIAGVAYSVIIIRRARRQTGYRPVFEDWLWHAALPLIAYAVLVLAAVSLLRYPERALFLIAAVALLLLFIGIHNAWDTVTYIAVGQSQAPGETEEQKQDG